MGRRVLYRCCGHILRRGCTLRHRTLRLEFAAAMHSFLFRISHSRAFRKAVTPREKVPELSSIANLLMRVIPYSMEPPKGQNIED